MRKKSVSFSAAHAARGTEDWRRFVQAYLATVVFVYDQIGKLMDALESCPRTRGPIRPAKRNMRMLRRNCVMNLSYSSTQQRFPKTAPRE
jgi:hypothetical protein